MSKGDWIVDFFSNESMSQAMRGAFLTPSTKLPHRISFFVPARVEDARQQITRYLSNTMGLKKETHYRVREDLREWVVHLRNEDNAVMFKLWASQHFGVSVDYINITVPDPNAIQVNVVVD